MVEGLFEGVLLFVLVFINAMLLSLLSSFLIVVFFNEILILEMSVVVSSSGSAPSTVQNRSSAMKKMDKSLNGKNYPK